MTREMTFPVLHGWNQYDDALASYEKLVAERREIGARLEELPSLRREAQAADDTAQADAIRAGGKDPGRKKSDALKAEAEATQIHLRVLSEAIEHQRAAVLALLASDAAGDVARATAEHASQVYGNALEELLAARERFHAAKRTTAWLKDTSSKPMWTAPAPRLPIGLLPNGAMVSMNGTGGHAGVTGNGEPFDPAPVFQAMRDEANPPTPEPVRRGRYVTRQTTNAEQVPDGFETVFVPEGAA